MLAELRARDVSALSASQRAVRERLINELARYARRGRFPRNLDFAGTRMPYFTDAFGTRCAMAHLIEATGDVALVSRVSATMNNAFIRELEADPELQTWLERAGFSAAEAARVQPTYCHETNADRCFCFSSAGASGVVEGTVTARDDRSATVRVDALHGDGLGVDVGEELSIPNLLPVGTPVLVSLFRSGADGGVNFVDTRQVNPDGSVLLECGEETPPLMKEDAIAAVLAGANDLANANARCVESLGRRDPLWEESICGPPPSLFGCTATAGGAASPILVGSALMFAAWSRRRGRRRWHVRKRA